MVRYGDYLEIGRTSEPDIAVAGSFRRKTGLFKRRTDLFERKELAQVQEMSMLGCGVGLDYLDNNPARA